MISTLRSLVLGTGLLIAAGVSAQYPYWLYLNGVITNCYPGQTVNVMTLPGTEPAYNLDVVVDPNTCTWSAMLGLNTNPSFFQASTLCNGMVVNFTGQVDFNFLGDSASVAVLLNCGGMIDTDGDGIPDNADNCPFTSGVIGSSCNDGDPNTINDALGADCICAGLDSSWTYDCLGVLNGQSLPGTFCVWNNQPGLWSLDCVCVPDSGDIFDCLGVTNGPNMPGTYCVNFFGDTGVWSANCVCETNANTFDCLGVLNGPDMPGSACIYTPDSGNTFVTGAWNLDCVCGDTTTYIYDCLSVLNGLNMPGTACTGINWLDSTNYTGTWSTNCQCLSDTLINGYDCLGILNGPNMPGTTCDDGDIATVGDMYTWDCVCTGYPVQPCQANFWVLQAFDQDSVPVPYELWVWNLSSGGTGAQAYTWSFGDGTSSTEPYPTHTYSGSGPYVLCLTIVDLNGCTSIYCDSIAIDPNGIYGGVLGGEGDRTDGFTVNVQIPIANSVDELVASSDIVAWPNPTAGELNIAMTNNLAGAVDVTITDLNGRVVLNEVRRLINGKNQLRLSTEGLDAGMYMVRIGNGTENVSVRFVKAN